MRARQRKLLVAATTTVIASSVFAADDGELDACFAAAEAEYQVPSCILRGIHQVETSGSKSSNVVSRPNRDGTRDYGIMQHNDFWIRYFQRNFGITAQQIVQDRCLAIRGAGYVLRYEMNRARDFWTGVAKYHNPDPVIGYGYVLRVANAAKRFGCQIK
ncbi:lytic transglycosylase domain-containing protein [Cupriavidus sp. BIC8F]|uniref:lytic transglycosylase domain-containing protein n=1 Tax=Cupriavidus sp. BIC8F TaxID=3079014 RepID=UPI002915FFE5|nr:lytic transglycosylase domain-containing protein [Cupriavidus sp. BIC8F]